VNDPFINEAINTQPQLHESGDYWTHLGNTYDSRAEALQDATPQQVVTGSRGGFSSPKDVSARFSEAGIPGIRYLDQGSRINGDGTHNFVVFNDDLTNIVSRNGQPINKTPMAAGLAAPVALMDFNQEPPRKAEPQDLSFQFNTPLTPAEQSQYQIDMGDRAKDTYDYDLQGFWKSGGRFDGRGHATDQFKKPNHPTFSDQSMYSNFATPGGQWSGRIPENSAFTPSETNLNNLGTTGLKSYFDQVEPGAKLNLPAKRKDALSDIFTR
jgi:hypothetical protein